MQLLTDSTCVSDALIKKQNCHVRNDESLDRIDHNIGRYVLHALHIVSRAAMSISSFTIEHTYQLSQ